MNSLYPSGVPKGKAIFFASDLHAGAPSRMLSAEREKHFIRWIELHTPDAAAFYFLGDLWDFWFEYKEAVPKGYIRLLGALAAVTDAGVPVFFQAGNHDLWLTDYLTEEVGMQRIADPYVAQWQGCFFFISHGHKVGPIRWIDRFLYAGMENSFLQGIYRWLHPDIGLKLGSFFSGRSRIAHSPMDDIDLGEKEYTRRFVRAQQGRQPADWYIFGHRHLALIEVIGRSRLVLLGDWIRRYTFLRLQDESWGLYAFQQDRTAIPVITGEGLRVTFG
ncbi:MAG: UDP-2,3-diacylglucosamine diphosphatase [Bacteroidia bacterium]|nr:UDP-2,3-diacylglucosamine diphosphatase [Bacteroidia bacterium]